MICTVARWATRCVLIKAAPLTANKAAKPLSAVDAGTHITRMRPPAGLDPERRARLGITAAQRVRSPTSFMLAAPLVPFRILLAPAESIQASRRIMGVANQQRAYRNNRVIHDPITASANKPWVVGSTPDIFQAVYFAAMRRQSVAFRLFCRFAPQRQLSFCRVRVAFAAAT
jgi:hypothetical protein